MNQYGSRAANDLTYEQRILIEMKNGTKTKEGLISRTGISKKIVTEYLSRMKSKGKIEKVTLYLPK